MSSSKPADPAFAAALDRVLQEFLPGIADSSREQLLGHYRLLIEWNRRLNLTRVVEPKEAARRHFGEALFLGKHLPDGTRSIVDVGSGAGFPGLPIAAARPEIQVTCVESVGKKANFLREVTRDWDNARVLDRRIEDVQETFDWAVLRAVAIQPLLSQLAEIAPRIAFLGAEEAANVIENDPNWRLTASRPLPWKGSGVLLLAERL